MSSQSKPASKRRSVSRKKPISQRKLDANRRNAQKSTGPKTARGKRIVAGNALKHGLMSQSFPILPYENEFEYRAFADAMERDLAPVGILQREIVTHITLISWRLRRIPAIEAALLAYDVSELEQAHQQQKDRGEIDPDTPMPAATAAIVLAGHFARRDDRPYERLEMHRNRLERGLHAALRQLEKLREQTQGEELDEAHQALYEVQDGMRLKAQECDAMKEDQELGKRVESMESPARESQNSCMPSKATVSSNFKPGNEIACDSKATEATPYTEEEKRILSS